MVQIGICAARGADALGTEAGALRRAEIDALEAKALRAGEVAERLWREYGEAMTNDACDRISRKARRAEQIASEAWREAQRMEDGW